MRWDRTKVESRNSFGDIGAMKSISSNWASSGTSQKKPCSLELDPYAREDDMKTT